MKKPTLCYCFTLIAFIELNFPVAFLLIRETWDDWFAGKVRGWEILRNGGLGRGGGFLIMGGLMHLYGLCSWSHHDMNEVFLSATMEVTNML